MVLSSAFYSFALWLHDFALWVKQYHEAIVAVSTVWIALFTLALFWSTYRLWKAGERHAEKQLRAYVFVEGHKSELPTVDAAKTTKIPLTVWNRGQTPAYKVTRWSRIEILPYPLTVALQGRPSDLTFFPIDFGPNTPLTIHAIHGAWSKEQIVGALNGTMRIYVYGEVSYEDIFETKQTTEFRFMARVLPDSSLPGLEACEDGNKAT